MLAPETLGTMTHQQRAHLFDQLARAHYGTASYGPQLSADMDVALATIYRWKHGGPPWPVLFTLDAWTQDLTGERKQLVWAARTAAAALLKALSVAQTDGAAPPRDAASAQ